MKKTLPLASLALFFLTACLIARQIEPTPEANQLEAVSQTTAPPTSKPIRRPSRWATSTPKTITPAATITTTPNWDFPAISPADRSIYINGLAPEYYSALDALPYASLYSIDFVIADELYRVAGVETVIYFNAEDVELTEIHFRLYPNILGGEMRVKQVSVNDADVVPSYSLDNSQLIVPLKKPLQPKESVTLRVDFSVTVAQNLNFSYGVQSYYESTLALAHAYPMIAVYDETGWNGEVPAQYGDITYADAAFFVVTVEAPKNVTLVASGYEARREEIGDRQKVAYIAGPARDFYLAASPEYQVFTKEVNGVALRFYARSFSKDGAEAALTFAARAIEIFSEKYAPYPYSELDFVATPTKAGGMEYPGVVAVAREYLSSSNFYLESIVAHEVGHQWFYNMVGNNQLSAPWLDESLAQFVTLQYFDASAQEIFRQDLVNRWTTVDNQEIPVGLPVRDYSQTEYGGIVYGRGVFFFEALRENMGARKFDVFMKDYTKSLAWDIATPEKFKAKAEARCACDLTPLFERWIFP